MKTIHVLFVIILLVTFCCRRAYGDCSCETDDTGHEKHKALKYKIAAFISILIAGGIGVSLPFLGKKIPILRPEHDIFFVIKAFAAGVILATGFIHILPDAFADLTSPCLNDNPWAKFPFTGFVAMVSSIITLMIDSFSTGFYNRMANKNPQVYVHEEHASAGHIHVHSAHDTHAHAHASSTTHHERIRFRVIAQVIRRLYNIVLLMKCVHV